MKIVDGWIDTAIEIDYGNKSMDRNGWKPSIIVLHGTAGGSSAQNIATYFRDSDVEASAHIVIGQDGAVVQGISMNVAAWGNGPTTAGHAAFLPDGSQVNGNWYTISIEHVKPSTDNSDQLTEAQKNASFAVIKAICNAYGIPGKMATNVTDGGILPHSSFDPVNRARCPGPYPWSELWAYLNGQQEDEVKTLTYKDVENFFVEDTVNKRWYLRTPNSNYKSNYYIGGDILKYYCVCSGTNLNGMSQFGLPRSYEYKVPGKKRATIQIFERGAILFDPDGEVDNVPGVTGACMPAHIDEGLALQLLSQPLIKDANTQISAQRNQITQLQAQLAEAQAANHQDEVNQLTAKLAEAQTAIQEAQTSLASFKA